MGDGSGKVGFDIDVLLQTVGKLAGDPDVVHNDQIPEVEGQWPKGESISRLYNIVPGTIDYARSLMTATDTLAQQMADGLNATVKDLDAADHAAAIEAAKLIQELADTHVEIPLPPQCLAPPEMLAGAEPGKSYTALDMDAIMQAEAPKGSGDNHGSGTK